MVRIVESIFPCSQADPLIGILAGSRIGELPNRDELLLHSGGPITDLSQRSFLPSLDSIRILFFEPQSDDITLRESTLEPTRSALSGEIFLTQAPPLVMLVQEWQNGRWNSVDELHPKTLAAALEAAEKWEIKPTNLDEKMPIVPGGFAGLLGYDLSRWSVEVELENTPKDGELLGVLWRCDAWWVHEREEEKLRLLSLENHPWASIDEAPEIIQPKLSKLSYSLVPHSETDASHAQKVEKIRDGIRGGHLYQVNYGRRWTSEMVDHPWNAYLRLNESNPAPFSSWLHLDDHGWSVASASPERLLKLQQNTLSTRPIKGTRARGSSHAEDERLRIEMASSEKEIAEHLMLVDLERHDLGRVCKTGSVHWSDWRIEALPTVQHLVSGVSGELLPNVSFGAALSALFPGGSITGCPKTVTMAAIDELEGAPRSAWTGSIGHIHSGAKKSEFNILIRTLEAKSGPLNWFGTVQAGGGIVIGSTASAEVEEARWKAAAVTEAAWGFRTGFSAEELPERELGMLEVPKITGTLGRLSPGKMGRFSRRENKRVLLIDNLDSFTENIADAFARIGAEVRIVAGRGLNSVNVSEQIDELIEGFQPTHIVLGPGPSRPEVSKITMEIANRAIDGRLILNDSHIPLLGWCLGHQALGRAVGWDLVESPLGAIHGVPSKIFHDAGAIFSGIDNPMTQMRYNSLVLKPSNSKLQPTAWDRTKTLVMGLRHDSLPIHGVQFHPESVGSPDGAKIISSFIDLEPIHTILSEQVRQSRRPQS
jgi:anthranilate synthase/aminodeoxychorismate synthase-like glutamine amidotransferase